MEMKRHFRKPCQNLTSELAFRNGSKSHKIIQDNSNPQCNLLYPDYRCRRMPPDKDYSPFSKIQRRWPKYSTHYYSLHLVRIS
jgi:hypothetical protein